MAGKKSIINKKILFIVVGVAIFIGLGIGVWHFADVQPTKFDSSLYGKSEAIDISKNEYEQMIGDKKSFAVLIDSPTCIRSKKIERMMGEMDSKYQFKYYRMMWKEVKESSLHNYVKFLPSLAIIRNGKVKAWLRADKDEDKSFYDSREDLQGWLIRNIRF